MGIIREALLPTGEGASPEEISMFTLIHGIKGTRYGEPLATRQEAERSAMRLSCSVPYRLIIRDGTGANVAIAKQGKLNTLPFGQAASIKQVADRQAG